VGYDRSTLSALTRFFSSAVFREMAKKGRSPLFGRLINQTDLSQKCGRHAKVADAFDMAFSILKKSGHRDEYVYRVALAHKVLMGKHSLKTASMLNEFRAGSSRADIVILNGTATVYEIKSERDSLARLANQVRNYQRVFASVNVIASEGHVKGVLDVVPDDVGVMCLTSRYRISTIRDAIDDPERVCPSAIFESLRAAEAESVLKALGVAIPSVPNTRRHAMLREFFLQQDPAGVHAQMVRTLKRTRSLSLLSDLIDQLPRSLHAAALSIPLRRAEHDRLAAAVGTRLDAAMAWA